MLTEAIKVAKEGHRRVYVLASDDGAAKRLRALADTLGGSEHLIITTPERVKAWNWEIMRSKEGTEDDTYFVDHETIEARFSHILEVAHKFDRPERRAVPRTEDVSFIEEHEGDIIINAKAPELEALGDALKLKARLGSNFACRITGWSKPIVLQHKQE
jgi:hypothetical protein